MRHVGMHVSGKGCMNASTHATLQYIALDAKICNLSCMHSCMHVYVHVCKKNSILHACKTLPMHAIHHQQASGKLLCGSFATKSCLKWFRRNLAYRFFFSGHTLKTHMALLEPEFPIQQSSFG